MLTTDFYAISKISLQNYQKAPLIYSSSRSATPKITGIFEILNRISHVSNAAQHRPEGLLYSVMHFLGHYLMHALANE